MYPERLFFFAVMLLMLVISADGQIRITRADIEGTLTSGTTSAFTAIDAEGSSFDLGSPGSGNSYDFTGYTFESETYERVFIDVTSAPDIDLFPDATHVEYSMDEGLGEIYLYTRLDDTGLYILGSVMTIFGMRMSMIYDPPMPRILFPVELGKTWSYSGVVNLSVDGLEMEVDVDEEVLGEGMMDIPEGRHPVLCTKGIMRITQRVSEAGSIIEEYYTTQLNYSFFSQTGFSASITADTLDINTMTPLVKSASYFMEHAVNVDKEAPVASELSINAIWPNPVLSPGELHVSWSQESPQIVEITVHDMLGRRRATLFNGWNTQGIHSARVSTGSLPAASYILRVRSGTQSSQRMISIIR